MGTKGARDNPQQGKPDGFSKAGSGRRLRATTEQIAPVESVRPERSEDNPESTEEGTPDNEGWFDRMIEPFDPAEEEDNADDNGAEEARESESEAHQAKAATIPVRPAQKEVDEHMLTHLPYRA